MKILSLTKAGCLIATFSFAHLQASQQYTDSQIHPKSGFSDGNSGSNYIDQYATDYPKELAWLYENKGLKRKELFGPFNVATEDCHFSLRDILHTFSHFHQGMKVMLPEAVNLDSEIPTETTDAEQRMKLHELEVKVLITYFLNKIGLGKYTEQILEADGIMPLTESEIDNVKGFLTDDWISRNAKKMNYRDGNQELYIEKLRNYITSPQGSFQPLNNQITSTTASKKAKYLINSMPNPNIIFNELDTTSMRAQTKGLPINKANRVREEKRNERNDALTKLHGLQDYIQDIIDLPKTEVNKEEGMLTSILATVQWNKRSLEEKDMLTPIPDTVQWNKRSLEEKNMLTPIPDTVQRDKRSLYEFKRELEWIETYFRAIPLTED